MSYCRHCAKLSADDPNVAYHDTEYGFPQTDDAVLFERLVLEIMQAGLSWSLILRKRPAFQAAFDGFCIEKVAAYDETKIAQLLDNAAIIRNRLKIRAVIFNANVLLQLQQEYGSFHNWLNAHHPRDLAAWLKLFKSRFRFVGGEIVREFLTSTGYLDDAHDTDCPIAARIAHLPERTHN
ncbi:MAG: DNA-3-methyladenine glycosylase I [Neisseria sp.]|nr:DNA-3-methyladenine glycosylase I [Neisseria sp.]